MRTIISAAALAADLLALAPVFADDTPVTKVAATECAALGALRLPDVAIASAEAKAPAADKGRVKVPHCKVTGVIGTEIRFEVLLPDTWNRRFAMGGGGGFVGSVAEPGRGGRQSRLRHGRHRHRASGRRPAGRMGARQPRATGQLRVSRRAPHLRGRQGDRAGVLRQRQRLLIFPGLLQRRPPGVDGGPAISGRLRRHCLRRTCLRLHAYRGVVCHACEGDVSRPGRTSRRRPCRRPTWRWWPSAALDSCDVADGVKDTVIDQPSSCRFSLDRVKACPNDVAAADCLTTTSRAALARIYAPIVGPVGRNLPRPTGGRRSRPGRLAGVDHRRGPSACWRAAADECRACAHAFGTEFFKYFVFGDPAWDYTAV